MTSTDVQMVATVIQTAVLFVTLLVVALYTVETYKLRKNSDRQQELATQQAEISRQQAIISERQAELSARQMENAIRPFVALYMVGNQHRIRNWGVGPALDVIVDDVLFPGNLEASITFPDPIPLLGPGEHARLATERKILGAPYTMLYPNITLHERDIEAPMEAVVHYRNVEGKEYTSRQLYGNGTLRLSGVRAAEDAAGQEEADGTPDA